MLAGFALAQFGALSQRSYTYLWLNLVGSGILAILAAMVAQWGFLLLEGVWAIVSLWSLAKRMLDRDTTGAPR